MMKHSQCLRFLWRQGVQVTEPGANNCLPLFDSVELWDLKGS